ncbi:MAG: glycosyl transferase [Cyanobacteria bacterium P01_D01_bin.73]
MSVGFTPEMEAWEEIARESRLSKLASQGDRPLIYVAITSHGFGHATRSASVVATLQQRWPALLPIMVTRAPRWLLDSYLEQDFVYRPQSLDVGVVQGDSLFIDRAATLDQLRDIRTNARSILAEEVDFIRQMAEKGGRVVLILADLPPLAAALGKLTGIPCWAMGNFSWDFIYRDWGETFAPEVDWIREQFRTCDRLFRLPFSEPMDAFPNIVDVGLTGGMPRFDDDELRDRLRIPNCPNERTVLLTFGGLGLDAIPYDRLGYFSDWHFITFDRSAPSLPNLTRIADPADPSRATREYRPVDLLPLCGKVVSKPGYSTFSEACRLDTPIVSIKRQGFAEAPILLEGLRNYAHHQIIDRAEFFEGDWMFLKDDPTPPRLGADRLDRDGNGAIARAIVDQFRESN